MFISKRGLRTSVLIGIFSIACLMTQANAAEAIKQSMAADPNGTVEIEHVSGSAVIKGWEKNEVSVEGTLGESTKEFRFERNGKSIQIIVEVENNRGWNNWGKSDGDDLLIYVPRNSKIDYTSVNADLEIEDIKGGTEAEVVNGDINVTNLSGRVRLESVNGDIEARSIDGQLKIETVNGTIAGQQTTTADLYLSTVNGDIDISSSSAQVNAESVNGDIELTLDKVDEVELSTVNGSIQASMHLNSAGDVRASSVGGSIELAFQDKVAATFDIEAHAGGAIKNKLTNDEVKKAKYGPRKWLDFSTDNPTASVDVSTVHGRVTLKTR